MPSDLEPRTGWARGNAGIIRELLRYTRAIRDEETGYAVQWPAQHPSEPKNKRPTDENLTPDSTPRLR
jgi:hypothetical protein